MEDREEFIKIMDRARDVCAPEGLLEYAMLVDDDFYETLSEVFHATNRR